MDVSTRPQKHLAKAILFAVLSCVFYALMSALVKLGAQRALDANVMIFWRNLVSLVILLIWLKWKSPEQSVIRSMRPTNIKMLMTRGISSFAGTFLYFYSLKYLTLTNASLLFNTMPIFVPIVAHFWQGFAFIHRLWWGIGLAFIGVIVVLKPDNGIFDFASLIALASGLVAAIAMVSLRMSHYSEPSDRMLFYLFVISMVFSGVISLFSIDADWRQLSLGSMPYLIGCGILGFGYQAAITITAKHAPVRLISVFFYFTVVLSMLLDVWIWHQSIGLSTWIGFVLIATGAILMLILYPKDDLVMRK